MPGKLTKTQKEVLQRAVVGQGIDYCESGGNGRTLHALVMRGLLTKRRDALGSIWEPTEAGRRALDGGSDG